MQKVKGYRHINIPIRNFKNLELSDSLLVVIIQSTGQKMVSGNGVIMLEKISDSS